MRLRRYRYPCFFGTQLHRITFNRKVTINTNTKTNTGGNDKHSANA